MGCVELGKRVQNHLFTTVILLQEMYDLFIWSLIIIISYLGLSGRGDRGSLTFLARPGYHVCVSLLVVQLLGSNMKRLSFL